jgi:hypothetical protein
VFKDYKTYFLKEKDLIDIDISNNIRASFKEHEIAKASSN